MVKKKVAKKKDISQKVVILLLIVAILISIVGTWAILDKLVESEAEKEEINIIAEEKGGTQGRIGLTIAERPENEEEGEK